MAAELAVERWLARPGAVERDLDGRVAGLLGLSAGEARRALYPVTPERPLPDGWAPPDLVYRAGKPLRAMMVDDLAALFAAAAEDGLSLGIVSAYRSAEYQAALFELAVARQVERADGPIDRQEAERRASRFVARPGHSQHQLGTAIDFSSAENGFALGQGFRETRAAAWLARHGWEFGFVVPYTAAGSAATGYVYEPWHLRWVGRPLAGLLEAEGYQASETLVVDRYLESLEKWLDRAGVP